MKQYAEEGRIGLCHKLRNDGLYVKSYQGGYPYLSNGVIVRSSKYKPIYSYGKNYEMDDEKFALFVWSINGDKDVVEPLLDAKSKLVTEDDIKQGGGEGSFIYID